MRELEYDTVESSELVDQTFKFWFNDNQHIRSPFPSYIQTELKSVATAKFFEWANGLNPKAKEEFNDEMIGEKFEEIIFEVASTLVKTEDEKMTIMYPFLPRLGDLLNNEDQVESTVVDRSFKKDGDHNFIEVSLEKKSSGERWSTKFELPV